MKVAVLGAGTWGFCLAALLANKGIDVSLWTRRKAFADELKRTRVHPKLAGSQLPDNVTVTYEFLESDVIVESVTAAGIRPVFGALGPVACPVVLTSKGIEQGTGLLLPEVVVDVGIESHWIGALSGPSHAEEVTQQLPTSIVCSAYNPEVMALILDLFTTPRFRIYPNRDLNGVCFGGAMKNVIAIACGISDGLGYGDNTKAALMTRGLHEIRKLSVVKDANPDTLNGLSGLGDLCVTCMSKHSRNYRFGVYLAEGFSPEGARQKVGMAVEGIYSCVSARELGLQASIPLPITEAVHGIIYGGLNPREAVLQLLQRTVKEEHL